MTKKRKAIVVWVCVILALLVGVFLTSPQGEKQESIKEVMRDAVMHDVNQISLFGVADVNAGLISGVTVTSALLIVAALIRVFFIPKFQYIPGKFQLVLEQIVGFFADFAKKNSPHRHRF